MQNREQELALSRGLASPPHGLVSIPGAQGIASSERRALVGLRNEYLKMKAREDLLGRSPEESLPQKKCTVPTKIMFVKDW